MLGKPVPDFSLSSTGGTFRPSNTRLVPYFYPRRISRDPMKFPFEPLFERGQDSQATSRRY